MILAGFLEYVEVELMTSQAETTPRIHRLRDIDPVHCLCGSSHRIISDPDRLSFHVVDIDTEAKTHYHRNMTEYYVVLAGEGEMELNGDRVPVAEGDLIELPPGTRHRALGKLRVLVVADPGFDRQDEYFD
jgi:mannose-6-phosphate isomerase-like protein (cupin superfamily)